MKKIGKVLNNYFKLQENGEGLTIVSSKEVKVIGSGKDKDVKKK